MNEPRLPLLTLALCLLLGGPLLAQRPGAQSRPSAPASRPAPAPAPLPAQSRPAPSRPTPQARPAPSRPAPQARPAPSRPTSTPTYTPPPRTQATPSASRPAPSRPTVSRPTTTPYAPSSRPLPGRTSTNSSRSSVSNYSTPRTTTRSDVSVPNPAPRSYPGRSNSGSSVGSSSGTARPAPSAVGGSVRSTASSSRDLYNRSKTTRSDYTPARTPSIDSRYKPTTKPTSKPTSNSTTSVARPSSDRSSIKAPVKSSSTRPTPSLADRFRPADTVRPNTSATRPNSSASMNSGSLVRSNESPRLNPRSTASGAVSQPRSVSSGVVAVHNPYCSPYYSSACWNYTSPYHLYCGSGPFYWGISLWYPWYWGCSPSWYGCHYDWWWNSSCYYGSCGTTYGWYPSSVYCPTYLYVPSSLIYYSDSPPAAPAAADEGEVKVAGEGKAPPPRTLAEKYLELGDFYFRAGRFAEAADSYSRARTYAPNDAGIHFVLADAAFANDDYHFAAFLIKEALRLDPALASAKFDKRTLYGEPKLFDEQMAKLERYLEEKPYDAMAHLVRGYNLLFSDRIVTAIVAFRRVLEIAPGDVAAQAFLDALEEPSAPVEAKPAAK